jgi:hypothetical protein
MVAMQVVYVAGALVSLAPRMMRGQIGEHAISRETSRMRHRRDAECGLRLARRAQS